MIHLCSGVNLMVVLAGPSGVGKTTIARRLVAEDDRFGFAISATTRSARSYETHGVDYWFLSETEFETMVHAGEFLEWAEVHGQKYGTPRKELESAIGSERFLVMDIDVQGAAQVKDQVEDLIMIFLLPPSVEVLVERLKGRGTEKKERLLERLQNAREEVARAHIFDYMLVNDNLDQVVNQIREGMTSERWNSSQGIDLSVKIREFETGIDEALEDLL